MANDIILHELTIDAEFKGLIPPLTEDEYSRLEKSILAEGVRDPIITWGGIIIDGHNRYRICHDHGIGFKTTEREFASRDAAKIWIIENQFGRRNLSKYDRSVLALQLEPLYAAEAKRRQATSTGGAHPQLSQKSDEAVPARTDEQLAQLAGTSRDTIRKVKVIETEAAKGNPVAIEVKAELESGEKKSIHGAYVRVTGDKRPRSKEESTTEDGRRICVMCGEPINEGEAHPARPTVHKKCEQEYQRDWDSERGKHNRQRYKDAAHSLKTNIPTYTVESLVSELLASADAMKEAMWESIQINEGMGVKLTTNQKTALNKSIDYVYKAIRKIGEH